MPAVRTTLDDDGVTTLWLDAPGKSVNVFTAAMLAEMVAAVEAVTKGAPPRGLILASAKPASFAVGADIYEMAAMDRATLDRFLTDGQRLCDTLAALPAPTVAAINGHCLGGGLELALACDCRVVADEPKALIGLPELKIGLLPAWGGTTRLPRVVGLQRGLRLVLTAATLSPAQALAEGIVDAVVESAALMAAAKERLGVYDPQRRDRAIDAARREALAATTGEFPAAAAVIEAVRAGLEKDWQAGLDAERRGLLDSRQSEAGAKLLQAFIDKQRAKAKG